RGALRMINDDGVKRCVGRLQFKSERLNRCKNRWANGFRSRAIRPRSGKIVPSPIYFEIVEARESSLVEHRTPCSVVGIRKFVNQNSQGGMDSSDSEHPSVSHGQRWLHV